MLWQTFTKVDSCNASNTVKSTEMILTNPNDQGIYLTYDKPDTIYTLQPTPVVVKFSLANTFTIVENGYAMLPHVNIHSCNADAGACTPFVKNTPGKYHSVTRNLTDKAADRSFNSHRRNQTEPDHNAHSWAMEHG